MIDLIEIRTEVEALNELLLSFHETLDIPEKQKQIAALEEKMSAPNFWDDQSTAQKVINEMNAIKGKVDSIQSFDTQVEDCQLTLELLAEELDEDLFDGLKEQVHQLKSEMEAFELELLLTGPHDHMNAIVEIHPGAGGTESCDWAEMLYRMYTRYAEKRGYKVELLDYQAGDEAGIKSVAFRVQGPNAFGFLKSERGVHRLVRISPFDSAGKRHTSFSSCNVMPEFDDEIEIEIKDEDLKIDTFRSGGAGGQSVNTTDSAVRITHLPTGTVVTNQNERSQIQNREVAMKTLKSKLYQLELDKQEAELAAVRGEVKEIGWGSQIRSYVFHPYSMVKDARTKYETSQVQAVMDGELDGFVDAYLKKS